MSSCHACGAWVFGCFLLATCEKCMAQGHDGSRGGPWTDEAYIKDGKTPACGKCAWTLGDPAPILKE
jgi:hypothetical protein